MQDLSIAPYVSPNKKYALLAKMFSQAFAYIFPRDIRKFLICIYLYIT